MLGNGVSLPNGLSLRATRASDAAFLATLYHSTRDDLQLIDDRDLSETLIEMQQQAQTDGYGESWLDTERHCRETEAASFNRWPGDTKKQRSAGLSPSAGTRFSAAASGAQR